MVVSFKLNRYQISSQYVERILDEIANTFNEKFAGCEIMLQRFRICFALNPRLEAI